jgi:hypothetical protein
MSQNNFINLQTVLLLILSVPHLNSAPVSTSKVICDEKSSNCSYTHQTEVIIDDENPSINQKVATNLEFVGNFSNLKSLSVFVNVEVKRAKRESSEGTFVLNLMQCRYA